MEAERKISFNFKQTGRISKSNVFSLEIAPLKLNEDVGISRDILIPFYSLIREEFSFLENDDQQTLVVNYRGVGRGKEELLRIVGEYQASQSARKDLDEASVIKVEERLLTSFDKYLNGDIYHKLKWATNLSSDHRCSVTGPRVTIEEYLVGVGFKLSSFRFAFEEFTKHGFIYRFLNLPSKSNSFELKIEQSLILTFEMGKGGSASFCRFIESCFAILVEIFALEDDVSSKFYEIIETLQTELKPSEYQRMLDQSEE